MFLMKNLMAKKGTPQNYPQLGGQEFRIKGRRPETSSSIRGFFLHFFLYLYENLMNAFHLKKPGWGKANLPTVRKWWNPVCSRPLSKAEIASLIKRMPRHARTPEGERHEMDVD
jgi:hypothetical protein